MTLNDFSGVGNFTGEQEAYDKAPSPEPEVEEIEAITLVDHDCQQSAKSSSTLSKITDKSLTTCPVDGIIVSYSPPGLSGISRPVDGITISQLRHSRIRSTATHNIPPKIFFLADHNLPQTATNNDSVTTTMPAVERGAPPATPITYNLLELLTRITKTITGHLFWQR